VYVQYVLHLSFIAPADKIADKKMCAPTCVMQYADEVLVPAHAYKKNAPAAVAPNFLHPTFAQKEIFAASPATFCRAPELSNRVKNG
jgi:hypothetical protein